MIVVYFRADMEIIGLPVVSPKLLIADELLQTPRRDPNSVLALLPGVLYGSSLFA